MWKLVIQTFPNVFLEVRVYVGSSAWAWYGSIYQLSTLPSQGKSVQGYSLPHQYTPSRNVHVYQLTLGVWLLSYLFVIHVPWCSHDTLGYKDTLFKALESDDWTSSPTHPTLPLPSPTTATGDTVPSNSEIQVANQMRDGGERRRGRRAVRMEEEEEGGNGRKVDPLKELKEEIMKVQFAGDFISNFTPELPLRPWTAFMVNGQFVRAHSLWVILWTIRPPLEIITEVLPQTHRCTLIALQTSSRWSTEGLCALCLWSVWTCWWPLHWMELSVRWESGNVANAWQEKLNGIRYSCACTCNLISVLTTWNNTLHIHCTLLQSVQRGYLYMSIICSCFAGVVDSFLFFLCDYLSYVVCYTLVLSCTYSCRVEPLRKVNVPIMTFSTVEDNLSTTNLPQLVHYLELPLYTQYTYMVYMYVMQVCGAMTSTQCRYCRECSESPLARPHLRQPVTIVTLLRCVGEPHCGWLMVHIGECTRTYCATVHIKLDVLGLTCLSWDACKHSQLSYTEAV